MGKNGAMNVSIKVTGPLARPRGGSAFEHETADGTTLRELLAQLEYRDGHIPSIMTVVNGEAKGHGHVLRDGDRVELFLLVGGG